MTDQSVMMFTSEFPKPNMAPDGVFTAELVRVLGAKYPLLVVSPVPWFPAWRWLQRWPKWYVYSQVPRRHRMHGVEIYYPRYLAIPVLSRLFQGFLQAISLLVFFAKIQRKHPVGIIHGHGVYPDCVAAAGLAWLFRIPLISTAIGSDVNSDMQHPVKRRQALWALRQSRFVSAVSTGLVNTLISYGVDPGKIRRIPTGVNTAVFGACVAKAEARVQLGLRESGKYILFVGRLHRVKGLDLLMEAIARIQALGPVDFQVLLIGDGEERTSLVKQCEALGISESVVFVGPKPHGEVALWMSACDVFCLPSRMEGLPNVIIEALACGRPVVAGNVGGIPELIEDRKNGFLFVGSDPDSLACALRAALVEVIPEDELKASVSWADWDAVSSSYIQLYEQARKREQ